MSEINILDIIKPPNVKLTNNYIDILIVLSDNEGYSESELSKPERLGKSVSNLSNLLDNLSIDAFGDVEDSIKIKSSHFKEPVSLIYKTYMIH